MDVLVVLDPDPELDAETCERLSRQLRTELAELDIESIRNVAVGTVPDGAKGIDPVTVGEIILAMSASGGVFTSAIATLRDWLGRHAQQHRISVTIDGDTIQLDRASAAQQQQLVDAYVRRHCVE